FERGWLYDGIRAIAEIDATGAVVARFIYGTRAHVPDLIWKATGLHRVISDERGSPRLVINVTSGSVAQRLDYDVWGNVLLDTAPGFQPFGFVGGLYDSSTHLTRLGARDYDAETGRWTNKDPSRFGGGDSNLYAYGFNDPVGEIDSSGREVRAVDSRAEDLIAQLRASPKGAALYDYLDSSPYVYTVRGNAPLPLDLPVIAAGRFKPGIVEGKDQCAPGGAVDLYDAIVRARGADPVENLAHELTHAGLYDDRYLHRPGAPQPIPLLRSDADENGGIPGEKAH